jgi:hypothetical protein
MGIAPDWAVKDTGNGNIQVSSAGFNSTHSKADYDRIYDEISGASAQAKYERAMANYLSRKAAGNKNAAKPVKPNARASSVAIAHRLRDEAGLLDKGYEKQDEFVNSQKSSAFGNFLKFGVLPGLALAGGAVFGPALFGGGAAAGTGSGLSTGALNLAGQGSLLTGVGTPGGVGGILSAIKTNPLYKAASSASKVLNAVNNVAGIMGSGKAPSQKQSLAQQSISSLPVEAAQAPDYNPTRPDAMMRPESLNELSAYAPDQERSYLATKGVNTGLGDEENRYYRNLIQRSLIGDGGKVSEGQDFLMPIESQYFSQQGQNTSDIMEFLKGLQT